MTVFIRIVSADHIDAAVIRSSDCLPEKVTVYIATADWMDADI